MPWLYHIIYPIAVLLSRIVRLWAHWQVRGKENVPKRGSLVVVSNHLSLTDAPLLGLSLGRKAMFMAKEELFRSKLLGFILHNLGAFPVRKGRIDKQAMHKARQWLAEGGVLIIFPEGRRSQNAQLQPALSGSALIALRSGAPILPVGISGTEKVRDITSVWRRPRVTVNIGQPFYLPPINGNNGNNAKLTKEKRAELTHLMMQNIAELLPPEYRGAYNGHDDQTVTD